MRIRPIVVHVDGKPHVAPRGQPVHLFIDSPLCVEHSCLKEPSMYTQRPHFEPSALPAQLGFEFESVDLATAIAGPASDQDLAPEGTLQQLLTSVATHTARDDLLQILRCVSRSMGRGRRPRQL